MNKVFAYWMGGWKPLGRYIVVSSLVGMSFVPLKFVAVTLLVFIDSMFVVAVILGLIELLLLPVVLKWASDSTNKLTTEIVFPMGFAGKGD